MKTLAFSIFLIFFCVNLFAQAPQAFNYQTVIRDLSGKVLTNKSVNFRITILQGSSSLTIVYSELHSKITNEFGQVDMEIGRGTSPSGNFADINWGAGTCFMKVEIDPAGGTTYQVMGTSQLLSVPYALYANTSADAVKLTGNQTIAGNKTFTDTISAGNKIITHVDNPVHAQDAATKAYVDQLENKVKVLTNTVYAGGIVEDVDGNIYQTVKIGTQVWMAENLRTTRYKDTTAIENVMDNSIWSTLTTGAYCWYNNDINNKSVYGALYNSFSIHTLKLCPNGWHAPSNPEWINLITFLRGELVAGGKMKSTTGWNSPNTGATNESGFSALPGGARLENGNFVSIGTEFCGWSNTYFTFNRALCRVLFNDNSMVDRGEFSRLCGLSVRCIKD